MSLKSLDPNQRPGPGEAFLVTGWSDDLRTEASNAFPSPPPSSPPSDSMLTSARPWIGIVLSEDMLDETMRHTKPAIADVQNLFAPPTENPMRGVPHYDRQWAVFLPGQNKYLWVFKKDLWRFDIYDSRKFRGNTIQETEDFRQIFRMVQDAVPTKKGSRLDFWRQHIRAANGRHDGLAMMSAFKPSKPRPGKQWTPPVGNPLLDLDEEREERRFLLEKKASHARRQKRVEGELDENANLHQHLSRQAAHFLKKGSKRGHRGNDGNQSDVNTQESISRKRISLFRDRDRDLEDGFDPEEEAFDNSLDDDVEGSDADNVDEDAYQKDLLLNIEAGELNKGLEELQRRKRENEREQEQIRSRETPSRHSSTISSCLSKIPRPDTNPEFKSTIQKATFVIPPDPSDLQPSTKHQADSLLTSQIVSEDANSISLANGSIILKPSHHIQFHQQISNPSTNALLPPTIVEVNVGRNNAVIHVIATDLSRVAREINDFVQERNGGKFIMDPTFKDISPEDFACVAEWVNTGEYVPRLERVAVTQQQGLHFPNRTSIDSAFELPDLPGLPMDIDRGLAFAIEQSLHEPQPTLSEEDQLFIPESEAEPLFFLRLQTPTPTTHTVMQQRRFYAKELVRSAKLYRLAEQFDVSSMCDLITHKIRHAFPSEVGYEARAFLAATEILFDRQEVTGGELRDWIITTLARNLNQLWYHEAEIMNLLLKKLPELEALVISRKHEMLVGGPSTEKGMRMVKTGEQDTKAGGRGMRGERRELRVGCANAGWRGDGREEETSCQEGRRSRRMRSHHSAAADEAGRSEETTQDAHRGIKQEPPREREGHEELEEQAQTQRAEIETQQTRSDTDVKIEIIDLDDDEPGPIAEPLWNFEGGEVIDIDGV